MTISIKNFSLFLISNLFLFSCANVTPPSGGPKDVVPPALVKEKSFPQPNTINYKGNVVELTFDESVIAENLQEQLLITPLEDNPYKVVARKNKVRLEFEKPFLPNTTYTFNFREGIKDITERNITPNLIIPFSTGPYLDSIYISGNVVDLKTNQPKDNILVSLYKSGDTLSPINSNPLYFTKTISGGNFRIQNIKSGTYDLYAIEDKNKSLKYEEPEEIAFLKNIKLDSSLTDIQLKLVHFDATAPYIKKTQSLSNSFEVVFNEGVQDVNVQAGEKEDVLFNTSRDGKTIILYNTFTKEDSIPVSIQVTDSSDNTFNKDVKVYFTPPKDEKEEVLSLTYRPLDKKLNPQKATINILFNKPITKYTLSDILIKEDTVYQKLKLENIKWINKTDLEVSKEIKARDSLILIIPENTFYFQNTPNQKDTVEFDIKEEKNYGSISGTIKTNKSDYIVELLDNNYAVVERLINPSSFTFPYLEPGSYSLRAIEDLNKNERWDSGNIKESKQPEPVYYLKNKIDLRANWEVQDIVFEF